MALDKVTTGVIADDAVTGTQIAPNAIEITDVAADVIPVKPHIQPGVLQPAVAGKLLDGTTSHGSNGSTAYGTAQADGRKYYYTDIKGSKPIKDPRIGAHFGSQRHKFKSLQLLEQETATHGQRTISESRGVYSVDGREWCRMVNVATTSSLVLNDDHGHRLKNNGQNNDGEFYEIVGYFNDMNVIAYTVADTDYRLKFALNGAAYGSFISPGPHTTVNSPLSGRYVDTGSVVNLAVGATLGINTVKISTGGQIYGCELIAQDTSSTANKSKIQIPAQNVVSYGKKFSIPATAPHYDPFNGFTSGSSVTAYVDTATSLGIEGWKNSSTYYRPYNGGRVVKWIASDGTIKTSVNMMPPNAKSVKNADIAKKANASVANDTYLPTFESGAIDHSLSEVAKTFHWREFGNGAANGGAGGTKADASMIHAGDDIAYVMDDGLTSFSGEAVLANQPSLEYNIAVDATKQMYTTFIGTGISVKRIDSSAGSDTKADTIDGVAIRSGSQTATPTSRSWGWETLAQNLPYGTHIWKHGPDTGSNFWRGYQQFTFHQPKMPPIPEDAVVIADYMLMADYVKGTAGGAEKISKGLRLISTTRDCFHDTSAGAFNAISVATNPQVWHPYGMTVHTTGNQSAGVIKCKLPAFGTYSEVRCYADRGDLFVDDVDVAGTVSGSNYSGLITQDTASTLGSHIFESRNSSSNNHNVLAMGIASPIHTSSHYQSFETPYLHELVGGDRNMEQTNLIVTPDGKSWDEVTRDVGYIGNKVVMTNWASVNNSYSTNIGDEFRGIGDVTKINLFNKDFAIAYDRLICLKNGQYQVFFQTHQNSDINGSDYSDLKVNGTLVSRSYQYDSLPGPLINRMQVDLDRGDYIQLYSAHWNGNLTYLEITRL